MDNYYDKYKNYKKIVFYEFPEQHAKLLIQLHYDGLKQGEFFRTVINGYINGDQNLFDFIQKFKLASGKAKTRINKIKREKQKERGEEEIFSLNPTEVENIFDIIEQELVDEEML